ncbi:pectinesterase [Rhizomicrobium palustre]|uniref:Pectinesterase n=1 Tax=Rhizomicrobium palustre TaxID=189966 RepID=A0A846MUD5_9PROT|nr:pectinesterase family protein [Rhizomicrobium palustre]NIK86956.1 pectinesterase [Rhizomicrobium palustre]
MMRRRAFLAAMTSAALFSPVRAASSRFDAVVRKTPGKGEFASITAALAAAPGDKPFRILVTAGEWRERVNVEKPFVELIGEGRDKTVIVSNASAGDKGENGKPIGTFGTPTIYVKAPDFTARHLTISNDFDYAGHLPKPVPDDKTGASGSQAVALAIQDKADRVYLEDVRLTGNQDTLFVNTGRSVFRGCRIEGNVDFIFGAGRAVFDACEIVSLLRPNQDFNGFVVAPDTNVYQPYGFVLVNCKLMKQAGVAAHTVALGRAWRRTGTFPDGKYGDPEAVGATVYINCWMDDHIVPEGWYPMGYSKKDGTRTELMPEEARLFEFGSTGPGARPASPRRRILSAEQAKAYDAKLVLDGWMPQ